MVLRNSCIVSDGRMMGQTFIGFREHVTSTNDTCLFMTSSLIDQPSMLSSPSDKRWAMLGNETCLRVTLQDGYLEYSERLEYSLFAFLSFDAHRSLERCRKHSKRKWSRRKVAGGKECRDPYLAYLEQYACATMAINYEEERAAGAV